MPLSTDENVNKVAGELKDTLRGAFGTPPAFRPAHAKGIIAHGTFVPTADAGKLSSAPHLNAASTPVIARFSNSTGIPQIPDTDGNANPRGFALRFTLPDVNGRRVHTDLIAHSTPFFPVKSGQEFLDFLHALGGGTVQEFLGGHPAALAFVQAPKPFPASFGRESYYGVNAFKFISKDGKETFYRHRVVPVSGEAHLSDEELKTKSADYLFEDLPKSLESGPIQFKLVAQIAEEGDQTNDATVQWPASRLLVELGTITLTSVDKDSLGEQKKIIFDPIPRVEGIEPSDDPILDTRASLYLQSGKERRAAA
ncbi:heme-dependent catalase [Meredithblackwellia eburnea MCA 4105]